MPVAGFLPAESRHRRDTERWRRDHYGIAAPGPLELRAWHKEGFPSLWSGSQTAASSAPSRPLPLSTTTLVFFEENEDRLAEPGRLQPLPIEPGMLGLKSVLPSEFDQA